MTKVILFLSLLVMPLAVFATDGAADDATDDLNAWARERSETDPEVVDGVRMFRPTPSDGKLVVSDFFSTLPVFRMRIFSSALWFTLSIISTKRPMSWKQSSRRRSVLS